MPEEGAGFPGGGLPGNCELLDTVLGTAPWGSTWLLICVCVPVCACLWRSEADSVSFFRPFHFDLGSLAKPRAHQLAKVLSKDLVTGSSLPVPTGL